MQLYTTNEPLLPNLKTLNLSRIDQSFLPFLPFFLSPSISSISFESFVFDVPEFVVASVITNLPTLCPNLQDINLPSLGRDPMITAAASKMFFATNRNALRRFHADSPLTEEAAEAIYKLRDLCGLSVVIEKGTPIPSALLPNLIRLEIESEDGSDGVQLFHGATFGKLESVESYIKSRPIDDFFEAFQWATLSSSVQNTLSAICLNTDCSWNPNYSSLLSFTRLVDLKIEFSCDDSCSGVDDDILIDLSRAMPRLESLRLGDWPCHGFTGGVTANGLVALVHNCPNISCLRVHFRAESLIGPTTGFETTDNAGHSTLWMGCALKVLEVGEIPVPEGSESMVAITLLRIFPRIETIIVYDAGWIGVEDMIRRSEQIVDRSSRCHHHTVLGIPR